jgi:polysaccharide export outer membrane protein
MMARGIERISLPTLKPVSEVAGKILIRSGIVVSGGARRGPFGAALAALAFAAMLVAGCGATRGGSVPYEVQGFGTPDAPEPSRLENYKIAPLDQIKVNVFQVTDLSGDFEVDSNGEIAFPLIGTVKVADLTTRELQGELKQRLRKFVHDPVISVAVSPAVKRSVTVDGSVRQPGIFPVAGSMTLIQAIAMAHGLDEKANARRIAIFRRVGGKRLAAAFDLEEIRRGKADDPEIYSGDVIVVDGSKVKAIQRELLQALPVLGLFRPF